MQCILMSSQLHVTRQIAPRALARLQPCRSSHAVPSNVVFPHSETFTVDGRQVNAHDVIDLLAPSATQERISKMRKVVSGRCYDVVPVVEGLYDMGNLAAVCRSADALGFGAVHCIMSASKKFKRSQRAAAGADKWLDTRLWDSTPACLHSLKDAGYQIIVTHLGPASVSIQEVDWTRPTAFVLGNEKAGVGNAAVQLADHTAIIPMAGFVESFNISVAAALIMYEAQQQRCRQLGRSGDLTDKQQQMLMAEFLLRGMKHSKMMVGQLLDRPPPAHQKRFFKGAATAKAATTNPECSAAAAAGDVGDAAQAASAEGQQSHGKEPLNSKLSGQEQHGLQQQLQQVTQDNATSAA